MDEAQEYFDDTIETILSQARKYRLGMTMAHQTLDQLSPRLRSAFLSNTSFKCAGGVSAKDARALASELHTVPEFIEGMRRRSDRSEFAVWLKHRTPSALRMDVPLGFVERQATLTEEAYDKLIERNRARYCGTAADVLSFAPAMNTGPVESRPSSGLDHTPDQNEQKEAEPSTASAIAPASSTGSFAIPRPARPPVEEREQGKGGPKHRYLQSLVKELAERQGLRATIEAPIASGQVDVLLERDGLRVAVEISVTTPVEQERSNLRKCLDTDVDHVAVILAKSRTTAGRYRAALLESLSATERDRVSLLAPEDVPDFVASLACAPPPTETMVKGYRVRVSHTEVSPEEAKSRRDQLAKLVARSLRRAE